MELTCFHVHDQLSWKKLYEKQNEVEQLDHEKLDLNIDLHILGMSCYFDYYSLNYYDLEFENNSSMETLEQNDFVE